MGLWNWPGSDAGLFCGGQQQAELLNTAAILLGYFLDTSQLLRSSVCVVLPI